MATRPLASALPLSRTPRTLSASSSPLLRRFQTLTRAFAASSSPQAAMASSPAPKKATSIPLLSLPLRLIASFPLRGAP
ncbi:hypothetical protein PR202_ga15271 [Eleusine coracana subsp. coracana]|uniref:Uncharacterized protein n=1 Tax=Eleusine coracana subsp. coracana TaxID=191504 RepID=A0AAV5CJS8_ELECO|nr:hypothetical protein PR202_ga15271 [Eleusine coracana subsp. coracana]